MTITIHDDFDLDKILASGQCFRCVKVGEAYRFVIGAHVLYIRPRGGISYEVRCDAAEWDRIWVPYFDLGRSYKGIRGNLGVEGYLKEALEAGTGLRLLKQDPWEMLISFIISQRKNIPAIRKSIEALCCALGKTTAHGVSLFPTPEAVCKAPVQLLSDCALGYRVLYVQDAARFVCEHPTALDDWSSASDDDLRANLMQIKGVGIKVANCVMLFAYRRTSCVPVDVWIRRIIDEEYGGIDPFAAFGEHAGLLQQYAFLYAQENKHRL